MSTFLKHVGILKNTSKKVVLVFHELPGTSDQALVCDMEALPPRMHDAVMSIVESPEAQRGEIKDIYELLSRRLFPDTGVPVINELHNRGYLIKTPQNNVYVMPRPNVQISLDVLMAEIKRLKPKKDPTNNLDSTLLDLPDDVRQAALEAQRQLSGEPETSVDSVDVLSESVAEETKNPVADRFNQHTYNLEVEKTQSRIALAQSILKQAEMLQYEANNLIKKALQMAPELGNNGTDETKESTIVTREKVISNRDLPKGRSTGRPRRTAASN
jgi:hypothetical protein